MKRREFVGSLGVIASAGACRAGVLLTDVDSPAPIRQQILRQESLEEGLGDSVTYFCHSDGACLSMWPRVETRVEE